jgi:hypothetical protein
MRPTASEPSPAQDRSAYSRVVERVRPCARIDGRRGQQYQPLIKVSVSPLVTRAFAAIARQSPESMIPKSGHRFSEKIMLEQ